MGKRNQRAAKAFRRTFRRYAAALDAHLAGTLAGVDPEDLHELRVAIRRTRVALDNAKHVVDEAARRHFSDGFQRLATATSTTRDLDVALSTWRGLIDDRTAFAPVEAVLSQRRARSHNELACTLCGAWTMAFLQEWRDYLAAPTSSAPALAGKPIHKVVARRRKRAVRHLRRSTAKATTPEARHQARKDAKRLRYLTESFDVYAPRWRHRELKRLTKLQDQFGRSQDARVQLDLLAELCASITDEAALASADSLRRLLERRVDAAA